MKGIIFYCLFTFIAHLSLPLAMFVAPVGNVVLLCCTGNGEPRGSQQLDWIVD